MARNVILLALISLTLSHHLSLSSIVSDMSSRLHPASIQSCCRLVPIGHLRLAYPCKGIGECCLWVCSYFSSNVLHDLSILFGWFSRWKVGGHTVAVLWDVTSKICFLGPLALCIECLPMTPETEVQSQVESYQRLKKWFLILPCLTLSIIRYVSRVKWSNPGKGVVPSSTP